MIPLAVLSTSSFDATTVDPLSAEFGPVGAFKAHKKGHIEDADGDGRLDLVLHFRTQETGIQCGDTKATLTGSTFDGTRIGGFDSIKAGGCTDPVIIVNELPGVTALRPIYPNPFNPVTTISFTLAAGEKVNLRVYDVQGALVRILKDHRLPRGVHTVEWDGRDKHGRAVSTGVYFVRLVAGTYQSTRKAVLLK